MAAFGSTTFGDLTEEEVREAVDKIQELVVKTENLASSLPTWAKDYAYSLGELAYCGWCLSPWVSLPVWAMAAKTNRVRFGVKWVAGWIVAAGMAAFLRHSAETAVA